LLDIVWRGLEAIVAFETATGFVGLEGGIVAFDGSVVGRLGFGCIGGCRGLVSVADRFGVSGIGRGDTVVGCIVVDSVGVSLIGIVASRVVRN